MTFLFRFLFSLLLALGVAAQSVQRFDVAIGGADDVCVLTLPIPTWNVEFPGISHDTNSDIEFLAPRGGGRVLGLVNNLPGVSVVEVRPDLTTAPVVAALAGHFAEMLVADASGNLYIGGREFMGGRLLAVRADGTLRADFPFSATSIDLAADQCTLFYTPETGGVSRFDVCTGSPLPDFVTGGGTFVKILPDGGVLTASSDWTQIVRYDAAGALVRTYDIEFVKVLALGRGGTTFFAATPCDPTVREYDLATGSQLRSITADMDDVRSLVAYNGWTASLGPFAAAHAAAAVPAISTSMLLVLGALLALIAFRRLM